MQIPNSELQRLIKTVQKISGDHIKYKKSSLYFKILITVISVFYVFDFNKYFVPEHVAVIEIRGAIGRGNPTGDGIVLSEAFKKAVESEDVKAVLIRASSGGGAPLDAETFYNTVMEYRNKEVAEGELPKKDLYFSIEHMCASACYYMAAAFPEVSAHKSSIVGSIGVKMTSFGFSEVMDKVGVEYRTLTSDGGHKLIMDPFNPVDIEGMKVVKQQVVEPTFDTFIESIRKGRGDKVKEDQYDNLYSGLIWSGDAALERGLIDSIHTSYEVMNDLKEKYDVDLFQPYTTEKKPSFFERMTSKFVSELAEQALQ